MHAFALLQGGLLSSNTRGLDILVVIGGSLAGSAALAEELSRRGEQIVVLNVCGASDFCMQDPSSFMQQLQQQLSSSSLTFSANQNTACSTARACITDASGAAALGFDTQTKAAAELVGEEPYALLLLLLFFSIFIYLFIYFCYLLFIITRVYYIVLLLLLLAFIIIYLSFKLFLLLFYYSLLLLIIIIYYY